VSAQIADVTEATFPAQVVERSRSVPVVIDFWAEWCGPCRQLSPMLERFAQQYEGEIDVVKIDVDANPALAQSFRVQGIPAVKAVKDGRVVSEFTGVQPEQAVARFFATLAPSEADRLVTLAASQPVPEAAATLDKALAVDPGHVGAIVARAQHLLDAGDTEAAMALMARAPHDATVQRMIAAVEMAQNRVDPDELRRLAARADDGDDEARLAYGRALAAAGDHERAVEVLLDAVGRPATKEPAREALVELFTTLGDDHPVVRDARPRLARALF
jgi:putative thioredoxin